MMKEKFAGDRKASEGLLSFLDDFVAGFFVPKVPSYIQTYHLTLMTVLWSALIVLGGYLSQSDVRWLWLVSAMIFLQYFTDVLDGKVGKIRNTGLIKWGYYMDHFLDFIFLSSIIIAYAFLFPSELHISIIFVFMIFNAFMINSYLGFAATNKFKIHYLKIGPTETRFIFIILNTLIIIFGKTYLNDLLPYVLGIAVIGLVIVVFKTQREIWRIDEQVKGEKI